MRKISGRYIKLLLVFVAVLLIGVWYYGGFGNYDHGKMNQVINLTQTLPLHPSFHEVSSNQFAATETITITKTFSSDVDWFTVKQFYIESMAQNNWKRAWSATIVGGPEEFLPKRLLFVKKGRLTQPSTISSFP